MAPLPETKDASSGAVWIDTTDNTGVDTSPNRQERVSVFDGPPEAARDQLLAASKSIVDLTPAAERAIAESSLDPLPVASTSLPAGADGDAKSNAGSNRSSYLRRKMYTKIRAVHAFSSRSFGSVRLDQHDEGAGLQCLLFSLRLGDDTVPLT